MTDGTGAGTNLIFDHPTIFGFGPNQLTAVGSEFYFVGRDDVVGFELWRSDGTAAGTFLRADIHLGSGSGAPHGLRAAGNLLLFHADNGLHGRELWRSSGAGTVMVKDIHPGSDAAFVRPPILNPVQVTDGIYYFAADDGVHGEELWRSDGTTAGTWMVRDINPGPDGSEIDDFAVADETLFFSALTPGAGSELWRSDGTDAGTWMVRDINPGSDGSTPIRLADGDDTLFFAAFLDATGYEIWESDGTTAGTVLIADLYPGEEGSVRFGTEILNVDGFVYMDLLTPETGLELYGIDARGPRCDGRDATVFVDEAGIVRGGGLDGLPFVGVLLGTPGVDVILGTDGDDVILGFDGGDALCGAAGDDRLIGHRGDDSLDGGDGDDLLVGGPGADACTAGEMTTACEE